MSAGGVWRVCGLAQTVGRAAAPPRSKGQMTKRTPSFLPYLACGQTRACPEQTGEGRRELLPPGGLFFLGHQGVTPYCPKRALGQ